MPPRSRRVVTLAAGIVLLSLLDLVMTLTFLTHVGMEEANPLARGIMAYGSPVLLALWKAACVGLTVGILFTFRRTRQAEVGAWVCALVMGWLTVRWVGYVEQVPRFTTAIVRLSAEGHPPWMSMAD